ncbi:H/ACA ribonucleoprotein complex subunit 2-like protein [Saccoglossus kowalevskii]|uniref:H/ACA ribonucleoprotein complex subunit 2 n=1 Tax=Saccoglossus kowalevskii TaxID=10224 RepID=A0ABM0GPV1_SACKO|nr:PREDICTED: H/ACA ribonucleoprotein complex subunit 2-like protein-like [Saccoglossus kowalevskii]
MGKTPKKSKEVKEEQTEETESNERSYEMLVNLMNSISQPLAGRKLTKRLYKTVKKASKQKNVRRGVKEVQKFIKKGEKGFIVLAGDVTPIDVYCHIPVMCEDNDIPYAYVPSKQDLGVATGAKRPTACVLVKVADEYKDNFTDCFQEIQALPMPI